MARVTATTLCLLLGGCLIGDKFADEHWLWPSERKALARSFSLALKEPDAAQFKWMRVIEWIDSGKHEPTHYCGLISGKTDTDTLSGFNILAANIMRNSSGAYDHGVIEHVEGAFDIFKASAGISDQPATGTTMELCKSWGYAEFDQAE
jgi:hypothetical protein